MALAAPGDAGKDKLGVLGSLLARCCGAGREPLPQGAGHGKFGEAAVSTKCPLDECRTVVDRLYFHGGIPDNTALAALAFGICKQLAAPRYCDTRAVCLAIYREDKKFCAEVGTNTEVVGLAGNLSAVRCAVMKLVLRYGGRSPLACVEKLILVGDTGRCILPGWQCREMLIEHLDPSVPVVCAWRGMGGGRCPKGHELEQHAETRDPTVHRCDQCGRQDVKQAEEIFRCQSCDYGVCRACNQQDGRLSQIKLRSISIKELHPYPSPYRHMPFAEIADLASQFAENCAPVPFEPTDRRRLYETAYAAARAPALNGAAFAVCCAASALFLSGETRTCAAAAAESPCAVEAVVRLGVWLEEHASQGDVPQLILVCDQWGVLHAPFAVGRGYLVEHGFGDVALLVHDGESGELCELRCRDLVGGAVEIEPEPKSTVVEDQG